MRRAGAVAVCVFAVATALPSAQPSRDTPETLFRQGMTALHNFEYEDANAAFGQARQQDPGFAPAYWGEAMTYHQALWRRENLESGRQVLGQLGPTPDARAAKARDPKTRGLLGAVEVLFGPGDVGTRRQDYALAMGRLRASFPQDDDVAALYGLALLATGSRGLIGASEAGEGFGRALAGSAIQAQATTIFNEVLARNPTHPGALHYLIHAYDDPDHARLALDAARRYATVANGASHALHMPAHIFLQLGMWHEAEQSDLASFDASREWVERKKLPPTLRNYHALAWHQYELLQLGRFRDAQAAIDDIEPVVNAGGAATQSGHDGTHQPLMSDLSSMRARFAIETRRWNLMAGDTQFGNVNDLFAIGISAARSGNPQAARVVQQTLARRADAPEEGDLRPAIRIMEREMAALVELAEGRMAGAIEILEGAARSELALPAPLGLPAPIKPAPELLGEVLIEAGRPAEAAPQFDAVLKLRPNRSLSVLGRARAAAATGDTSVARARYRELLANYDRADDGIPELAEARTALAAPAAAALDGNRMIPWITGGIGAALGVAVVVWRSSRGAGSKGSGGSTGARGARGSRVAKRAREKRGG